MKNWHLYSVRSLGSKFTTKNTGPRTLKDKKLVGKNINEQFGTEQEENKGYFLNYWTLKK